MPRPRYRHGQFLVLLPAFGLVFCLLSGCQSQPKAPPAPLATSAIFTHASHYTGTPLSGPRLAVADVGLPKDALTVRVKWVAVSSLPTSVQETLASQCRLIIAGQSGAPMLVSPDLTKAILFDQSSNVAAMESQWGGPATVDFAPVASLEGALPPNVTAVFLAAIDTGRPPRNRITLRIARSDAPTTASSTKSAGEPVEMTLELAQDNSASTSQPSIAKSETAVFDRPVEGGQDQMAIVIPMTFSDSPARALIALINITPSATVASLAQCHADLQSSAEVEAKQPNVEAVEGSAWAGYDSALKALWDPADRRAALVFLASQTSAHICEDTALVADDATLEKLANTVAQQAAASSAFHTGVALSWLLDHAAFELLVLSDAPGNSSPGNGAAAATPLPPELRAVLTVYAGEPARHSGSLDEIAHLSTSRQDLENRLTAENLVFLTDSSPASRVRAFDWLKARGLAPAGFDPLETGKERRQALDKALPSSD